MGYAYPIDSKVVTNPNGTIDYDRAYSSAHLRGIIKAMITNGINLIESTNLQVIADEETMNLTVKSGYVIIEGALKHFEDDVKITIPTSDTNPRIDTIVARLNLNEDVRDIVIDVIQGTPSANPVAPELTRTTSYYELGLADVLVDAGAIQISQANVTDTRLLNSRCGLATSISEVDTETLFNQLTTDFNNWFESIKVREGNILTDLETWIDNEESKYTQWTEDKQEEYNVWTENKQQEYESWTAKEQKKYTDWINGIETDLNEDVALSMKLQIDELELKINESINKKTIFNEDGSIVEISGDEKRITIFNKDDTMTVYYYVGDILKGTKTIIFNKNEITEVFE